ncbi:hypothetical protein PG999_009718 [Apiospora kogelbergensis]|uniref:Uncharacterized protein n=1 Tax=Apiospora kogelbergensis TaxID=1337665 RepID=A0AAW0QLF6_9PEZI
MADTEASPRNASTDCLRSSIDLTVDRDSASSIHSSRGKDSNPAGPSAQKVSGWRLVIPGVIFILGCIGCVAGATILRSRHSGPTEVPAIFELLCNDDDKSDPAEQKFALDLTFGRFTFAQAKSIDIAWDTVIGQGGRFLHGWILYRYVLYPLLVVLMEHYAVTSDFYIVLSFSRTSFETLWALIKSIFRQRSITTFLCTCMIIFTLGYTLLFSVIWSAATGYVSLSQNFYPMPNADIVGLNSPDLTLCWELDGSRLGQNNRLVETGPSFADVGSFTKSFTAIDHTKNNLTSHICFQNKILRLAASGWRDNSTPTTVWDYLAATGDANSLGNSSLNFRSIRDYALTAQTLRMAVSGQLPRQVTEDTPATPVAVQSLPYTQTFWPASWWENMFKKIEKCNKNDKNEIDHVPFEFPGLALSIKLPQYYSIDDTIQGTDLRVTSFNETGLGKEPWDIFARNDSTPVGSDTLRLLPYNSTIWINNTAIKLDAPFLDVGHSCYSPSAFTDLGNCRSVLELSRAINDTKGTGLDQLDEKQLASKLKGTSFGYQRYGLSQGRDDACDSSDMHLVASTPSKELELSDLHNTKIETATQKFRDMLRKNRKRKPSPSEVYEDLNWRLYGAA